MYDVCMYVEVEVTYHRISIFSIISDLDSGVLMVQSSSARKLLVGKIIAQSGLQLVSIKILVGGNFNIGNFVLSITLQANSQLEFIRYPLGSYRDQVVGAFIFSINSHGSFSSIKGSLDKDSLRSTMKITSKIMTKANSIIINLEWESKLEV